MLTAQSKETSPELAPTFATPWWRWSISFVALAVLLLLIAMLVVPLAAFAFVAPLKNAPHFFVWIALGAGLLTGAGICLLITRRCAKYVRRFWRLDEQGILAKGARMSRRIAYEDVHCIHFLRGNRNSPHLQIDFRRGGHERLILKVRDARECFEALRELCPHAPAVDDFNQGFAPLSQDAASSGHLTLSTYYYRRFGASVTIAGVFLIIMLGLGFVMLATSASVQQVLPRLLLFAVGFVGSIITAIRFRRLSKAHRTLAQNAGGQSTTCASPFKAD